MEYGRFILSGADKKALSGIKNILTSNGHIYLGYSMEPFDVLRHIRRDNPDFVVLESGNNVKSLKQILEVIDDEMLTACILIMDSRNEEVFELIQKSRVLTYIVKPVFDNNILLVVDISLINYKRIVDYENKVRKLNDTLESRKIVEKAKWILVEQKGLSETEAYEAIKKKSRDNRMPMREIAEAIILTR